MAADQKKYAYEEPKTALNSRIDAHAKYSNFNLHEWIKENFDIKSGEYILDLGCGNGNYTELFWEAIQPDGMVIGLDKNKELIQQAQEKHKNFSGDKIKFLVHDFDQPFPQLQTDFDWVFAIYSIYYTEDSLKLVEIIKKQLKPKGEFIVIGPAPENAKDLADFNYELTGIKPNREYIERIERIEKEFSPLFERIFGKDHVQYRAIDSVMEFPTAESYADYYWSTLLWRESTEGRKDKEVAELKQKAIDRLSQSLPACIRKQMSCLTGEVN